MKRYPYLKHNLYEPGSCGVGFLCDIKGRSSNSLLKKALTALIHLEHRGAVGADPKTGDGAGILIQIPDEFFQRVAHQEKIKLPSSGNYGTGLVFLPQKKEEREFCENVFKKVILEEEQNFLGFRDVPVDNRHIGEGAKNTQPFIKQIFIEKNPSLSDTLAFERILYVIRKRVENIIRSSSLKNKSYFYITNLSSRTFSYKGLLMSSQLEDFFLDLKSEDIKTSLCLIHARYSTNTFPTWDLAQPFRFLAHNGEINTLRGNINWMRAREGKLASPLFKEKIEHLKPVIVAGGSDSAMIDNAFELLVLGGRPIYHAMLMLIPQAWENNKFINEELRSFYQYHACFMEPWDGPAAIAFTDGLRVGAVLDRNGLRPARYIITKDDLVIMASEVGVLDIPGSNIAVSGRLEPGKIFFVDTQERRIVEDEEIKKKVSTKNPYKVWIKENLLDFSQIPSPQTNNPEDNARGTFTLMKVFDYTREDIKILLKPMFETGKEPIGSMGNDTPWAVLSKRPYLLYNYFRQLFAQVTNPAIDPIREEIVMSLFSFVGRQENILEETPQHCHKLLVEEPILTNEDLIKLKNLSPYGFKSKTISLLFPAEEDKFLPCLDKICLEAEEAIKEGYTFIILSDRGVNEKFAALPALLACAGVHSYLVKKHLRTQIAIILETAEPREVHHFAVLFGYGADLINPYLVYDCLYQMVKEGEVSLTPEQGILNWRHAINKGLLKILSKMGISTLQSYRGAQIFEALGIGEEVIERCFPGTTSRIGGVDFSIIAKETLIRHKKAFSYEEKEKIGFPYLSSGGIYQWRRDGEYHLWNPVTISLLQEAVRKGDYKKYKEFSEIVNFQKEQPTNLRSLFKFKKTKSIPLQEVESKENIFKRFAAGAMSFGSISRAAHETLALALNKIGGRSNTGEGGEDPQRFAPLEGGWSKRSAVKQVASGRFGVTTNYLVNADELQIKIAQGAKPGEGGQLPGHKVSVIIARTRYTTPGVTLISPPPHHDIYSIEDLAQLIFDLKNTNPRSRISVKLVSEIGVGTIAAGVAKGHADMILISGGEGGTGASPLSSIRHAGLPWELGISETHQTLVLHGLRSRVRLQTDGGLRTGRDVALATILGAEEYGFCTAALIVMGCVMLRHCHLNTCSVGVATQDALLERRFQGRVEYVINYFNFIAQELRETLASLGIRSINELVGKVELLEVNKEILPWKAKNINYNKLLYKPLPKSKTDTVYCSIPQDHKINDILDRKLINLAKDALQMRKPVKAELTIKNINRTTGAMLSGEVCRHYGEEGLLEDTIYFKFKGVAGQSFGAWLIKGITFELEGLANDYVGKGISGGKIIIYPFSGSPYLPEKNIIIGNTCFYGAISGEAYIRGVAGERFCIRNSGLYAVVEGVGDHGCEYMTGGRVVVLGKTGRNFAAGMSGGIAYVYDEDNSFPSRCNQEMVELSCLDKEDEELVSELIHKHFQYTKSKRAKEVLDNFSQNKKKFIKVMPLEYKRILEGRKMEESLDLLEVLDG